MNSFNGGWSWIKHTWRKPTMTPPGLGQDLLIRWHDHAQYLEHHRLAIVRPESWVPYTTTSWQVWNPSHTAWGSSHQHLPDNLVPRPSHQNDLPDCLGKGSTEYTIKCSKDRFCRSERWMKINDVNSLYGYMHDIIVCGWWTKWHLATVQSHITAPLETSRNIDAKKIRKTKPKPSKSSEISTKKTNPHKGNGPSPRTVRTAAFVSTWGYWSSELRFFSPSSGCRQHSATNHGRRPCKNILQPLQ